jgi:hypothetical protein
MNRETIEAAGRVREIFANVVAAGFRPEMVEGASDDEIDRMAMAQGVPAVPAALREILRLIGRDPGLWITGSIFGVNAMDSAVKHDALECLEDVDEHSMRDPQNLLAVLDAAGSSYLVVDGTDLGLPDPPLWLLTEGGLVQKRCASVTDWFARVAEGVLEEKARLASRRARGKPDATYEAYFVWSTSA